jgi:hypothetical protein
MKDFSIRFRRQQFEAMKAILDRYEIVAEQWPAQAVMLLLDGVARFMGEERSYGLSLGHAQATGVVERLITQLEGQRVQRRKHR